MPFDISGLQPISSWIKLIKDIKSTFHRKLHQIYGDSDDLKIEAVEMCLRTLEAFADRYGADRKVIIIRSAGRVNLLARISTIAAARSIPSPSSTCGLWSSLATTIWYWLKMSS